MGGILLAAGASTRLGQPKQLLPWAKQSLLQHAINRLVAVCDQPVAVVTGAHRALVEAAMQPDEVGAIAVYNPDWAAGMGTSIGAGLAVLQSGSLRAVLIMPVDLPLVSVDDLVRLRQVWQDCPDKPAAALYSGILGPPAIFPREWFDRLGRLYGDSGARLLLQADATVAAVPMENASVDIDTPADLAVLQTNLVLHKP